MPEPPSLPDLHGDTHVGKVRSENQDHFLACTLGTPLRVFATSLPSLQPGSSPRDAGDPEAPGEIFLLAVADGVGGGPGGEQASRSALAYLPGELDEAVARGEGDLACAGLVTTAVLRVHHRLVEEGTRTPGFAGMATTLTAWLALGHRAFVIQVGDSRCYRLRDGSLEQLSADQTLAQGLVNRGSVTSISQAPVGWDNILTSALGGRNASPTVTVTDRRPGDVVLVCSDGVMKHFDDPAIGRALGAGTSARDTVLALVDGAVSSGGIDNVTAVVLREPHEARP